MKFCLGHFDICFQCVTMKSGDLVHTFAVINLSLISAFQNTAHNYYYPVVSFAWSDTVATSCFSLTMWQLVPGTWSKMAAHHSVISVFPQTAQTMQSALEWTSTSSFPRCFKLEHREWIHIPSVKHSVTIKTPTLRRESLPREAYTTGDINIILTQESLWQNRDDVPWTMNERWVFD